MQAVKNVYLCATEIKMNYGIKLRNHRTGKLW